MAGNKIRIPVTKVLSCASVGNLARSKKHRYWVVLNAVLLPPFLTEDAILDRKTTVANLLKLSAKCIAANLVEEENDKLVKEEEDDFPIEGEDMEHKGNDRAKYNSETLATIAANNNSVLAFFQAVMVKSPQIIATPLFLCADKLARFWFLIWVGNNLLPTTNAPQYHR